MKYLTKYQPTRGIQEVVHKGDGGIYMLEMSIASLEAGDSLDYETDQKTEAALIVLSGQLSCEGSRVNKAFVGQRKHPFDGKAEAIYSAPNNEFLITASTDCEIAICTAPANHEGGVAIIRQDDVSVLSLGEKNYVRDAHLIIDDKVPAKHLFVGEAFVPSGNWASFPPHRHDKDDPPHELDMEEIYYFRFDPPNGFGIQKIYTPDRSIDQTLSIEQNDIILIPQGYHPTVVAPGYQCYYLWIMAGEQRGFARVTDPDHAWMEA